MARNSLWALIAGAALSGLWACPKSPGALGGASDKPRYTAKRDPAADQALQRAISVEQTSSQQKALEAYLVVQRTFPETTAAQEAMYRAGVIYFESRDYVNAKKTFSQLLFENPLFDKADDVRIKLAQASTEVGAHRDAYQALSKMAERTSGPEKEKVLEAASKAAESGQMYQEALRSALRLLDEAKTPEDKASALQRVTDLVEGKVGFIDVAQVVQDMSPSNPAWPILTFKLARIYYHLRDWQHLSETLQRFLREAPQHEFAPQAKELLARASRRAEVRPRTLGVLLPMSGKYKLVGDAVLRGIQLALKGSDIEVVVKDTQADADVAAKAVEELAFDHGVVAILGPLLDDEAKRAALAAEELQVPILTLTQAEGVTQIGPRVFRNMLTNQAQARALVSYATKTLGYKSFALLYPNKSFGVELANDFWEEVVAQGGSIRGAENYSHDQTTFTAEIKKLVGRYYLDDRTEYLEASKEIQAQKSLDPFRKRKALEKLRNSLAPIVDFDAIFIPDDWKRVTQLAPALAVEDIITNACDPKDLERIKKTIKRNEIKTVTLLGSAQWGGSPKGRSGLPEIIERGDKFIRCSVYVDGFFVDSERPATKKFVKMYRETNKDRDPGLLDAIGYDSGGIFRRVIERGAVTGREDVRQRLAELKDFDGATGKTSFDSNREAEKPLFLLTIDSNGIRELAPGEKVAGS